MISVIDKPKMNESLYTDSQKELDKICSKFSYEPYTLSKMYDGYADISFLSTNDGIDVDLSYRNGKCDYRLRTKSAKISYKEVVNMLDNTNKFIKELNKFNFDSLPTD